MARFGAPSRAQLYTLGGEPAWLDARLGRPDDLMPTLFALWRVPEILPRIITRHSQVSHFLMGESSLTPFGQTRAHQLRECKADVWSCTQNLRFATAYSVAFQLLVHVINLVKRGGGRGYSINEHNFGTQYQNQSKM